MLDLNKPIRTKSGFSARLLCGELKGSMRIVVAVFHPYLNREVVKEYSRSGEYMSSQVKGLEVMVPAHEGRMGGDWTLENIPQKHSQTIWVNLYPGGAVCGGYSSREKADKMANLNRVECRKITYEWTSPE
jgi:hypothetical protein